MQDYLPRKNFSRDINQLCDISKWGADEILDLIELAKESNISYFELIFFVQDKIALHSLSLPDQDVRSICRCLDMLEDIFSSYDSCVVAELKNADLIGEIFNRIIRIVLESRVYCLTVIPPEISGS